MRFSRVLGVPVGLFSCLLLMGSNGSGDGGTQDEAAVIAAPEMPEAIFTAKAEALPGFKFDTGLLPASPPIQVQLTVSAAGGIKVDAAATWKDGIVTPRAGSGKLTLDLHVTMKGRLKVDTMLTKYDGDLPGLKSIDLPIGGMSPFDPFLLEPGQSAEVVTNLPETRLPNIPLGSIPGSLVLTVGKGSLLTTKYHGTCVTVSGGKAKYSGEASTSGKLMLQGQIIPSLPKPLNKPIDIKQFEVAIPVTVVKLEGVEVELLGAADQKSGTCP